MKSLLRVATLTAVLSLAVISSVGAQTGQATGACGAIPGVAGGQAHFGGFADIRDDGTPTGYLIFRDPSVNFRLRAESTSIDRVTNDGCRTEMHGFANTNFGRVEFVVTMTDNGEPGRGRDQFEIHTAPIGSFAPYDNQGVLSRGEIERDGLSCP